VGDLDDALTRPGRCFAHLMTRELSINEAASLYEKLVDAGAATATAGVAASDAKSLSIAEVYRIARD